MGLSARQPSPRDDFAERFPDDQACRDYLRDCFYPDGSECPECEKETRFHRITGRTAYSCQFCGHHVYPTAHTIFEKSVTPLHSWFHAIYRICTDPSVSIMQLKREMRVSYKTAWRISHLIRPNIDDLEALIGVYPITFINGAGLEITDPNLILIELTLMDLERDGEVRFVGHDPRTRESLYRAI